MLSYLYNLVTDIKLYNDVKEINYENFNGVLEYIPSVKKRIVEQNIHDCELMESIAKFCKKLGKTRFIVSLSGGVDSMVLITILVWLDYEVFASHINYNNREETVIEQDFIEKWCKLNNIKLYVKSINDIKRDTVKRSDYEQITKNIRLDFYREIMLKEELDIVLLGHHKDDIVENVFANVCRGRNYLDLAVIREESMLSDIKIGRPMIEHYKDVINDFAYNYQVPYFKNTTPSWSVRGKYREVISPAIEDAFTKNVKENLLNISRQADEWNSLIEKEIIRPFIEKINFDFYDHVTIIKFNIEKYYEFPLAFWTSIFMHIFNQFGYKSPSKKGIQSYINTINYCKNKSQNHLFNITLANSAKCSIQNNTITIKFNN